MSAKLQCGEGKVGVPEKDARGHLLLLPFVDLCSPCIQPWVEGRLTHARSGLGWGRYTVHTHTHAVVWGARSRVEEAEAMEP